MGPSLGWDLKQLLVLFKVKGRVESESEDYLGILRALIPIIFFFLNNK